MNEIQIVFSCVICYLLMGMSVSCIFHQFSPDWGDKEAWETVFFFIRLLSPIGFVFSLMYLFFSIIPRWLTGKL